MHQRRAVRAVVLLFAATSLQAAGSWSITWDQQIPSVDLIPVWRWRLYLTPSDTPLPIPFVTLLPATCTTETIPVTCTTGPIASLPPPGDYVLQLTAINEDNVESAFSVPVGIRCDVSACVVYPVPSPSNVRVP